MGDQEGRPYGVSSSLIRRVDVGIVPNEMFYGGGACALRRGEGNPPYG